MKTIYSITAFFSIVLLLFACNKNVDDLNPDVEAEILKEMQASGIPSLAACIVKDEQIVWEATYGYADIFTSKPADRQTIYTAMSVSKLILAIAIMQLEEQNLLELDADISNYLPFDVRNPQFPDEIITTRMLMTHTSGLAWPTDQDQIPGFYHLYPYDEMPLISEWLPDYILPGGSNYRSAVWKEFSPGEMELYSNIGTSVLALLIENTSGSDYMDYCNEYIFDPLEMYNSAFRYGELDSSLLATPYWNMQHPIHLFNYMAYPAGNVKSNIEDFSHFIIAILNHGVYKNKRILSEESFDKMLEIYNPTSGRSLVWGNYPGDCIGHSGGGEGFSSMAELYMDRDKGMVVFTNRWNSAVYPKGRIYDLLRYQCNQY